MNCTNRVAKTKALISSAVTAQLICAFVFAYAKIRFSHVAAHLISDFQSKFSTYNCRRESGQKHPQSRVNRLHGIDQSVTVSLTYEEWRSCEAERKLRERYESAADSSTLTLI